MWEIGLMQLLKRLNANFTNVYEMIRIISNKGKGIITFMPQNLPNNPDINVKSEYSDEFITFDFVYQGGRENVRINSNSKTVSPSQYRLEYLELIYLNKREFAVIGRLSYNEQQNFDDAILWNFLGRFKGNTHLKLATRKLPDLES